MKSLAEQMAVYQRYHTKRITKLTHFVGVPLALLAPLLLLSWVQVSIPGMVHVRANWLGMFGLFIYYLFLDWEMALGMGVIFVVLCLIADSLAGPQPNGLGFVHFIFIFAIAWTFQLIGHWFEGKKPALLDNLHQIFIAPLFLYAEVCFMLGKKQSLKEKIQS